MNIDILTLFPEMFKGPFDESIIKRALDKKQVEIKIHNLRDWSSDSYRTVDDHPYGGGAGMVMRIDVIDSAVSDIKNKEGKTNSKVILLDTKGTLFSQMKAKAYAQIEHLILIAGHYEGLDHRIHEHIVDEVITVGPYVLTGGELPAMIVTDAVVRLLPGVISEQSLTEESYSDFPEEFAAKLTDHQEYPQYTRPAEYKGWKVPEVLLSGNHKEIEKWRKG